MLRTRIAPSPTGFMHIGTLRTALYDYLLARKFGGQFILRIEDTDQARFVQGALENLVEVFDWIGLQYDEGPKIENQESGIKNKEVGKIIETGEYGSYVQSNRLDIYKKYADELLKNDHAYYCFCAPERLESLRQSQIAAKKASMYDGLCKQLAKEESLKRVRAGEKHVVRLNVPHEGETEVDDIIHGKIVFQNALLDDQVLVKSDGFPTYHLAVVVDDHLMKITHVIRGEEWLPSTPKHLLLYKALDWVPPQFAHLPLILNSNKTKLSKRQGDVAVEDYKKKGYLPEALLNFVALLGWNPGTEKEIYSLSELVHDFDLARINKSGAVFNLEKLNWLNGYYIRAKKIDELVALCLPHLLSSGLIKQTKERWVIGETGERIEEDRLRAIVGLEQERLVKLEDIVFGTEFFFKDALMYVPELLVWRKSTRQATHQMLLSLREYLETQPEKNFVATTLEQTLKAWIAKQKLDTGSVLWPMRVALSGRQASPSPFDIAAILGKKIVLKRLDHSIALLKI